MLAALDQPPYDHLVRRHPGTAEQLEGDGAPRAVDARETARLQRDAHAGEAEREQRTRDDHVGHVWRENHVEDPGEKELQHQRGGRDEE